MFGDDEAIAVTFRYGEAEHGVIGHIDLTGIPVAIAAGVAIDAASLIGAMTRKDDPFDRVRSRSAWPRRGAAWKVPLARCDEKPTRACRWDTLAYLPVGAGPGARLPAEGAAEVAVFTAADRAVGGRRLPGQSAGRGGAGGRRGRPRGSGPRS